MNTIYKQSIWRVVSKRLFVLMLFVMFSALFLKTTAQVSVTATAGTTGPTTYTTVNAAFVAINAGTHQGAITIAVTANTTEPVYAAANQLLSSGTASSSYTAILIQPVGNVTISSAATPTASRGVLEFIGADNVTIDGDDPLTAGARNLTIQVASTTNAGTAALRFSSASATANGCTNIIVKNCNIVGGRSSSTATTTSFGIFSGVSTAAGTIATASGAANNDNMLLENNFITRAYYGIYCYGITAYPHNSLKIRNNVVGTTTLADGIGFRGIFCANTQATANANSLIIEGNDVQVGDSVNGISTNIAGVDLNVTNAGAIIRNNNIHDVTNPSTGGWGAYGINLSSATSNSGITIYNNFIRDIKAYHYTSGYGLYTNNGIYSSAAVTGLGILHNTIVFNKPNAGSGTINSSACVYLSSSAATISEFRNNILANNQSDNTGQACANVYIASSTLFSGATAINRNNYWASGVSGYAGSIAGTNYQSLSAFKAVTLKDTNSLNFSPSFISSTDLHFASGGSSPFESAGDTTWLTTDYDGNTRPGPTGSVNGGGFAPDLGADEADMGLPSIATMATGTKTNITTNAATLAGTIVNNGGSNIIASGILLSTSPSPIRGAFGVTDSATNPLVSSGAITLNFAGLSIGTTYYYRSYGVNAIGTAYGPDSSFTTNASAVIPTVLKTAATGITGLAATTGGNITTDGGSPVFASGIVYATTPNPAIGGLGVVDSTTSPLVTSGAFTKTLGGLTHSTKYYYRAYATNAVGTAYSVQDSFTTQLVISVLPYAENFDGVTTPWTASAINTGTNAWVRGTPAKTNLNGAFSAPNAFVTGLTGSYSGTEDCVILSPQMNFSALTAAPILRFKHEMDVDADLGWDGGVVEISINGGAWTRLDPVIGTGTNFNTASSTAWYNDNNGFGTLGAVKWSANTGTSYASNVNGWITSATPLTGSAGQSNVRVRIRFWADGGVDEGWAIDNIEIFAPSAPSTITGTKTNVTTSSVTLAGNITDNGGNAVTASGIVISTSATPVRGAFGVIDSATNPLVGAGAFALNVTGLTSATTYYYRSYAVNGVGITYGADSTFTTNASAVIPTVLRNAATNVQAYSATVGGNITSDGGSTVFASGIVYATTPNPALSGVGVVDSTTTPAVTTGSFTINPAGLLHSTKYYYRAYATNSVGTAYSVQDSFTTSPVVSVFPYAQNFDIIGLNTGWNSAIVNGTLNNWALGTPAKTYLSAAFSGTQAWVTKLLGSYDDNHDAAVVSPQFDFSALTAAPILRFKHKFVTETNWDALIVEMSINGGAWTKVDNNVGTGTNFNTALSTSWYNNTSTSGPIAPAKFSGANSATIYSSQANGWITSITPLVGANGQSNVKVRFRFGSDASGVDEGVALDNIEVIVPSAPIVATGTKTNVTTSGVTLAGNIVDNGGNNVTASGIVISTSATPVRGAFGVIDSATNPLVGIGALSVTVAGLTAATTYYYRAYAVNAVGTSYGADSTFTTNSSAVVPTVLKVAASNIATTTASFGGNITSDGGSVVLASGVVYSSTNTLPAIGGLGVIDSTTNPLVTIGSYSFNAAGLNHSTKYYFRAYATNSVGTAYSTLDSFTTQPIIATLPYVENFDGATTPWTSAAIGTGTVNMWVKGTPAKTFISGAYSAPNAFVTGLTGNYGGTIDCGLTSPQFDFSTLTADPILRFRHKMDVDADLGWDGGTVEISLNGGATWTKLDDVLGSGTNYNSVGSYSWYNDASTNGLGANKYSAITTIYGSVTNGWIETATRLTGAAGQSNVKIRFRFWADAFGVDEGWAIDDINVVSVATPTVAASNVSVTPAATTANVSFTAGNGQGRLVVARLTSTTAVPPIDSLLYAASAAYGSTNTTGTGNYIVYLGTGTSVTVTGLTVLTGYTFDVYEFNGKYMHNKFAAAATSTTTTTPVKLLNFVGVKNANDAQLTWVTASERNNRGFNLERSLDGKNFEFVAFLQGKGNSNVKVNYAYTDKAVFANNAVSKVFYRLKQLDVDGKFEYSSIVSVVNQTAKATAVEAYPNPFNSSISINVVAVKASTANVEIFDISGRKLFTNNYQVEEGSNSIAITKLTDLNQGIYFVRVDVDGEVKVIKMIKN